MGEIMTGPGTQDSEDLLQRLSRFHVKGANPGAVDGPMLDKLHNLPGHFSRRQHEVGQSGIDSAARHAVIPGRFRVLNKGRPQLCLDSSQTECAVSACPGEYDTDGIGSPFFGQGAQEEIYRQPQPARLCHPLEV